MTVACVVLTMTACTKKTRWNGLDVYTVQKSFELTEAIPDSLFDEDYPRLDDDTSRLVQITVDMQFVQSDNPDKEKVCKRINAQLIEMLLRLSGELSPDSAVARYIDSTNIELRKDIMASNLYDNLTGRVEYGHKDFINYRLVEETYLGGAHPSHLTTILRFDAKTGEFVALDDVFSLLKHRTLEDMLLAKLMQDNGVNTLEGLQEKGLLELNYLFVSNNFALREDSIEFFYNEYDIAPYAYGPTTICLSYEQADSLMIKKD